MTGVTRGALVLLDKIIDLKNYKLLQKRVMLVMYQIPLLIRRVVVSLLVREAQAAVGRILQNMLVERVARGTVVVVVTNKSTDMLSRAAVRMLVEEQAIQIVVMTLSVNKRLVAHTEGRDTIAAAAALVDTKNNDNRLGERDTAVAPADNQMVAGIEMTAAQTGDGIAATLPTDGIGNSQMK